MNNFRQILVNKIRNLDFNLHKTSSSGKKLNMCVNNIMTREDTLMAKTYSVRDRLVKEIGGGFE